MPEDHKFRESLLRVGIISLVMIALMIFSRYKDYRGIFMNHNSYRTVPGIVTSSEVIYRSHSWHYVVVFEYNVLGKTYKSDDVNFAANGRRLKSDAQILAAQYPVGKNLTVYYDPRDPYFAVLEPTVYELDAIVLPVILTIITVLCFGKYFRMIQKQK